MLRFCLTKGVYVSVSDANLGKCIWVDELPVLVFYQILENDLVDLFNILWLKILPRYFVLHLIPTLRTKFSSFNSTSPVQAHAFLYPSNYRLPLHFSNLKYHKNIAQTLDMPAILHSVYQISQKILKKR